ncbi:hypothetical protein HaLaN_31725, partial [Haematococcus lacustris]
MDQRMLHHQLQAHAAAGLLRVCWDREDGLEGQGLGSGQSDPCEGHGGDGGGGRIWARCST